MIGRTLKDRLASAQSFVDHLEEGERFGDDDPVMIEARERLAEVEKEADGQQVGRAIVRLLAYIAVAPQVTEHFGTDQAYQRTAAKRLAAWALGEEP